MPSEDSESVWLGHYFQDGQITDITAGWDEDEVRADIASRAGIEQPDWNDDRNEFGNQSASAESDEARITVQQLLLGEFK